VNYRTEEFAKICLEQTGGKGVDVVFDNVGEAVMEDSFKSLAYNGRYLMMGFASDKTVADEKTIVPRRIALGNFKLCGVMLSYAETERQAMMKDLLGWNLPSNELGAAIMRDVVDRVESGRVRAVVGKVVEFEEIPEAITAMANRETVGRVVVKLWD
jgi:NADPH2:quinone reductase